MIIALPAAEADKAIALLNDKGENAWKIGYIKASDSEQRVVILLNTARRVPFICFRPQASMIACKLLPLPEISTTMFFMQ